MTKNFTLLMFFIGATLSLLAKNGFQIEEINTTYFDNTNAKTNTSSFRFQQTDYLVIQPKNNSESYLLENGITTKEYVGDGYYLIALASNNTKNTLDNIPFIKLGFLIPTSKIDKNLNVDNIAKPITVLFASTINNSSIQYICEQIGIEANNINEKYHHFTTYATAEQISKLSKVPFIYYVTKHYKNKNILLSNANIMLGTNEVQESLPYGYNLKGENINVGIWDDGVVGEHLDMPINRSFVVDKDYNLPAFMAHPTQVGACIGAAGNLFPTLRGVAPKCNMYFYDIASDIVNEISSGKSNYGIDISNHSYNFSATTCFESGSYIPEAADLDKVVYNNPTLLPVVAVGNTASANCAVTTDTFSSVDIGFQGSKNVITVGWLFSNGKIVGNSGRGPTSDGRLKPELVAKGFAVTTLLPNNGFGTVFGSSFAAPQIAGLAALMYQKYKQQFGVLPNASLVKAILCNTATDLGNSGPDYTYGFGIPNSKRAVNSINENLFFEDNIANGAFKIFPFSVLNNISKLKVTLVWTDKDGSPIAVNALVNDLDLKIVTPNGDTVLPWKLDPNLPKNKALRGIDKLNNIEQVSLDVVPIGNYKIIVKGTSIPSGIQNFSIAYYNEEKKIELSYPNGGEIIDGGTQLYIKWFNNSIDSTAKIEFSPDNGTNWQTVANIVQLSAQNFTGNVGSVVSNQCLIKITSGNNVAISASTFSIGNQINYPLINNTVCDKTIKINWPAVVGASAYKVYLFADSIWTLAGQTSLTTFTINNLINGKKYFYSISTIQNGFEGNRSFFTQFIPLANACTTLNDVGVYAINKPIGGRKFTSSTLSSTEKISFIIKNFGTATQNTISVSYKLNGGTTRTATLNDIVTSNDTSILYFNVNENLSAVGNYNIIAWTNLVGDNNIANDTLRYVIKHLPNIPLVLPFFESFENTNEVLTYDKFGIDGFEYADYYSQLGARFRTNEGNLYANSGKRAITLDNYLNVAPTKQNELIFTYNLSNYKDSLIYLDFNYLNRGEADSNDVLFARGNDTKPWVAIYNLFNERGQAGVYKNVQEINLFQKLKTQNNQDFTSSTQLKIVQSGVKSASSPTAAGGYTFDDFKLYLAGKDVALLKANIKKVQCAKSAIAQPFTILIKNNTSQAISNLPVSYKINNEATVNELVPNINANDTITYTFNTLINKTAAGLYSIKSWISNLGDNYKINDSVNTINTIVMKTIDSFPYYNDFEANSGDLFTEGKNSSWVWGTPAKFNINNAAQDNKAWTTGLNRGYNFNENSYLYMGCMDFSSLTKNPLIAFNFISVMQTQSDSAFAEYSTDGEDWKRLGCYNCGLNWYNGFISKPYWDGIIFPWQTAHIAVPLNTLADKSNFMYRINLRSDDYAIAEGLGIDDIHILKDYEDMATADSAYVTSQSSGNGWIQFRRNGKLIAELFDDNKNLGNVTLGFEANISKQKVFNNLNILPRNWVVKPQNQIVGNYKLRLYLLNSEYTIYTTKEDSINRMGDIGLLRYVGLNTNLDVIDNHVKSYYKYFTPQQIQFYPYQNGYYVEFNTDTLGEFYLISTKQDKEAIQNVNLIDFAAQKIDNDVYLDWKTTRETNSKEFVIQYSFDATTFIDIDTVPAGGFSSNTTLYNYLHQLNATIGIYYYRIKIVSNSNKFIYSLIDSVNFSPALGIKQNTTKIDAYIATNDIVIEFKNKLQTASTVNIYNSLGQLQFTKKMQLSNGINPLGIIDFIHWSNAAYYLQIQTEEHNYYSKLMKQ